MYKHIYIYICIRIYHCKEMYRMCIQTRTIDCTMQLQSQFCIVQSTTLDFVHMAAGVFSSKTEHFKIFSTT